jgi:membrane associated rhomboid family serine protease
MDRVELGVFLQQFGVVPAAFSMSTLFTSMFLHGSWSHAIGNLWYLWIFGDNVEDRLGHGRFLVFYLLCGIAAAFGQIAMDSDSTLPMIGASGAIAGVMGAYFVLYPHSRVLTLIPLIIFWEIIELPAIMLLGFWFLMQLFSAGAIAATASTGGGVAFMAHVAGFVMGAVAVFLFRKKQQPEPWLY